MRIGVLGTMVWDRIEHPDVAPVERWGGISYSLAAAAAALPDGWTIRPLIKVGRDLLAEAGSFLDTVPGLDRSGVVTTDAPNNRVHLRYTDRHDRQETLSGGVPAWRWSELEPRLQGLDGLYVNLISGFELELDTARRLRGAVEGLLYVDLHSLLLGVEDDGTRVPRTPDHRDEWLAAFDAVQLNRQELGILAGDDDPRDVVAGALAAGVDTVLETLGPDGARWYRRATDRRARAGGDVRTGAVPVAEPWETGDPTGCGDVWGATCFLRLAGGDRLEVAMDAANRAAARNVAHRGADGLYHHLRNET